MEICDDPLDWRTTRSEQLASTVAPSSQLQRSSVLVMFITCFQLLFEGLESHDRLSRLQYRRSCFLQASNSSGTLVFGSQENKRGFRYEFAMPFAYGGALGTRRRWRRSICAIRDVQMPQNMHSKPFFSYLQIVVDYLVESASSSFGHRLCPREYCRYRLYCTVMRLWRCAVMATEAVVIDRT